MYFAVVKAALDPFIVVRLSVSDDAHTVRHSTDSNKIGIFNPKLLYYSLMYKAIKWIEVPIFKNWPNRDISPAYLRLLLKEVQKGIMLYLYLFQEQNWEKDGMERMTGHSILDRDLPP